MNSAARLNSMILPCSSTPMIASAAALSVWRYFSSLWRASSAVFSNALLSVSSSAVRWATLSSIYSRVASSCAWRSALAEQDHRHRQGDDRSAKEHSGPHMNVGLTLCSSPSKRGDPQGRADRRKPLKRQETAEQTIRPLEDIALLLVEQIASPRHR